MTTEYVLFLVVTISITAAAIVYVYPTWRDFSGQMSKSLIHPSEAVPTHPSTTIARSGDEATRNAKPSAGWTTVLLCVVVGAIAGLAFLGYRWRAFRRRPKAQIAARPSPILPVPLELRTLAKRQQLWRLFVTDGDHLMKSGMEVRHLMTRELLTVAPTSTVVEAREIMASARIHHLLVCEHRKLLGLLGRSDLEATNKRLVRDVMRPATETTTPKAGLGSVIHLLLEKDLTCLPVVDGEDLCGIISTTDLALALHCSLQLGLRMAQSAQRSRGRSAALDTFSNEFADSIRKQEFELGRLRGVLQAASGGGTPTAANAVAARANNVLEGVSRLLVQAEAVHGRLRRYAEDWMSQNDFQDDYATALANRRELESVLALLLAIQERYRQPFSIVLVGMPSAREAGPAIIAEEMTSMAGIIASAIRNSDFVARLDDTTFAVVLAQTPAEGGQVFCTRLRASVEPNFSLQPPPWNIALASPETGDTVASLLQRAGRSLVGAEPALVE